MMIHSKNKGNKYEQQIRREFREKLYPDCETSRYASQYADGVEKCDLVNCGLLRPQLKATEKAPNFQEVLKTMPDDEKINIIFHKRNRKGEVVIMGKQDFYDILTMLKFNGVKI